MKTEDLKALGLNQEQIDGVMELKGKVVQSLEDKLEAKTQEVTALTEQLDEANSKIQEFADLDVDTIKSAAADWETKYKQAVADREHSEFLADIRTIAREAGAKNPNLVISLLEVDVLKKSKNRTEAIKEAIEKVKESDDYLFPAPQEPEAVNVVKPGQSGTGMTKEEILKIEDGRARRQAMTDNIHLFEP